MTVRPLLRLLTLLPLVLFTAGCPDEGEECPEGLAACAGGCVDLRANKLHCGDCGVACATAEFCGVAEGGSEPSCLCQPGTVACGEGAGGCVSLQASPLHCGACGNACPAGNVCEQGTCKLACSLGAAECNGGCVDTSSDALNCGGCGVACTQNAQSCREGRCTYDVVAACFSPGQALVGLNTQSAALGATVSLGGGPQALALADGVVLATDATNQKLHQVRVSTFAKLAEEHPTASSPNHVLVDGQQVYVVNSFGNTLQVFQRGSADAGLTDGLGLHAPVGAQGPVELQLGNNTSPQAVAKVGSALYLPLYGGFGAAAAEGGKVAKVDVSNPAAPLLVTTDGYPVALPTGAAALRSFDGGSALPRPYHVVAHEGALYVSLNNLDDNYAPAGPGFVVRIRPELNPPEVTSLELPADACQNTGSLLSVGGRLAVGCIGSLTYDGNFNIVGASNGGVVLLGEDDQVVDSWSSSCPVGQAGCVPASVTRMAARGNTLYVGDSVKGRVFVLEVQGDTLVERRGFSGDVGGAFEVCAPASTSGNALVSDLVSLP